MSDDINFTVPDLGARTVRSPLAFSLSSGDAIANYVDDADRVRWNSSARVSGDAEAAANLLEKAGPRERLYFNPAHVHAGVVTCGGLCPGLNDVIRAWYAACGTATASGASPACASATRVSCPSTACRSRS